MFKTTTRSADIPGAHCVPMPNRDCIADILVGRACHAAKAEI
jgi:hypothetical protein